MYIELSFVKLNSTPSGTDFSNSSTKVLISSITSIEFASLFLDMENVIDGSPFSLAIVPILLFRSLTSARSLILTKSPLGEVLTTVFFISSIDWYSPTERIKYSVLPKAILPPGTFKFLTFNAITI